MIAVAVQLEGGRRSMGSSVDENEGQQRIDHALCVLLPMQAITMDTCV